MKRFATSACADDDDSSQASKRSKAGSQQEEISFTMVQPVQQTQLGPFWITSPHPHNAQQQSSPVVQQPQESGAGPSLCGWMMDNELPASLSPPNRCTNNDQDTEDTASSDSCDIWDKAGSAAAATTAADSSEADSLTLHLQQGASAGFSFGERPCLAPDVSSVREWDILHAAGSLLALAQG